MIRNFIQFIGQATTLIRAANLLFTYFHHRRFSHPLRQGDGWPGGQAERSNSVFLHVDLHVKFRAFLIDFGKVDFVHDIPLPEIQTAAQSRTLVHFSYRGVNLQIGLHGPSGPPATLINGGKAS